MGMICCCSKGRNQDLKEFNEEENEAMDALIGTHELAKELKDHNFHEDDVKVCVNYTILGTHTKWEKEHPFYHMDVNGFCYHVKQAVLLDLKKQGNDFLEFNNMNYRKATKVSLSSLQKTFCNFKSWSSLNDFSSDFVTFLIEECSLDDSDTKTLQPPKLEPFLTTEPEPEMSEIIESSEACDLELGGAKSKAPDNIWFDLNKLKIVGILQCDGGDYEKLTELYHVLQDNNQEEIAAQDKDFLPIMSLVFDMATQMVFR